MNLQEGAYIKGYGPIVMHYALNESHSTDWAQLSAKGVLGIVYGKNIKIGDFSHSGDLIYKTIQADGSEKEETVTKGGGVNKSVLLYDSQSNPHIFYARSTNTNQYIYHFYKKKGGNSWLKETVINFSNEGGLFIYELSAVIEKKGSIHLLVLKTRSNPDTRDWNWAYLDSNLYHITNSSGNWKKQLIYHYDMTYNHDILVKTQRRQDIVVDKDGNAHVVFGEQITKLMNHGRQNTSNLYYATNKSGAWETEPALKPSTAPHDTGWNPSLSLDKTGRPAVAYTDVARVPTFSVRYMKLYYAVRLGKGRWKKTVVAQKDGGYYGGDGRQYTGALPHLIIDDHNTPHIAFSDVASGHGPKNFLNIGNIRYAVFNGSSWDISTIYRQPLPKNFFKAREMAGHCMVMSGDGKKIQVVGQEMNITDKRAYTSKLVHFRIK
ncbi:MAG: hypothetical protein GY940_23935 [bacterium]|nr:hypothetical protein [bacterium]